MQEKEIETLYPIKKNNKKRNIIIISIIVLLLVGSFIFLKNNNFNSKNDRQEQNEDDRLVTPPKEDEEEVETSEVSPNYVNYICEKEGSYGVLDNKISYKTKYRYEFFFDLNENKVTIGKYNVDYIFNKMNDYNNASTLPVTFNNTFYEENFDKENLTKTLIFYYILEYKNVLSNDLNSYLKELSNDKFICKLIEEEPIVS